MTTESEDDIVDPVHIAKIAGKPVRFFFMEGDPLPWTSLDDICRAANLGQAQRTKIEELVLTGPDAAETSDETEWMTPLSVITASGEEIVCHPVVVCGLFGSLIRQGVVPATFAASYRSAAEGALDAMFDNATPVALIERLRTVSLSMYIFDEGRPS